MLIDDDDVYNFLNKTLVEISGLSNDVNICKSASEGLKQLKTATTSQLPDVILLDIMMPDMDGHEFLSQFAMLPQQIINDVKIAMLTSSLDPTDKQKTTCYKFVIDFIEKPLTEDKLTKLKNKL